MFFFRKLLISFRRLNFLMIIIFLTISVTTRSTHFDDLKNQATIAYVDFVNPIKVPNNALAQMSPGDRDYISALLIF